MASKHSKIPIPLHYRWQRIRYRILPVVIFLICGFMAFQLWRGQATASNALGMIASRNAPATSLSDGTLIALPEGRVYRIHDRVEAGDVIGILSSTEVTLEIKISGKKIKELNAKLAAAAYNLELDLQSKKLDHAAEARRLAQRVETLRLDILDRKASIATATIERERQEQKLATLILLFGEEAAKNNLEIINTQLIVDIVKKKIESNTTSLAEAEIQLGAAEARLGALPPVVKAAIDRILAPLRADIEVEQAKMEAIDLKSKNLKILAPIDGEIIDIHRYPGESVRSGDRVMTIADGKGLFIEAYIRNTQRIFPQKGYIVEVRTRRDPHSPMNAVVEEVGVQFLQVPSQLLFRAGESEWGQPIRISLPAGLKARPNEMVQLMFTQVKAPTPSKPQVRVTE